MPSQRDQKCHCKGSVMNSGIENLGFHSGGWFSGVDSLLKDYGRFSGPYTRKCDDQWEIMDLCSISL